MRDSERAEAQTLRAEELLEQGRREETPDAVLVTRASHGEPRRALRCLWKLTGKELISDHSSITEDLSVIRARGLEVRALFDPQRGDATPESGALVEAESFELHRVGRLYPFDTVEGRRFPLERRRDLESGKTVELHRRKDRDAVPGLEGLEQDEEYWLAVTPPQTPKERARMRGEPGWIWFVFAVRACGS